MSSEYREDDSPGHLMTVTKYLEQQLQAALDKKEELEREKVQLERNLVQKSELYEDAMRIMHTMRVQHNDMVKAQMERICFLESEVEPARKEAQRCRELDEELVQKRSECKDLQDALEELENQSASTLATTRLEFEKKNENDTKHLLAELEKVRDEHAIATAAYEKFQQETKDMVEEHHNLRAQAEYHKKMNTIRAQLIAFLEADHVDSSGLAKIKEANRKLKIAKRSVEITSNVAVSPQSSFAARGPSRGQSQERSQSRETERPFSLSSYTDDEVQSARSITSSRPASARSPRFARGASRASSRSATSPPKGASSSGRRITHNVRGPGGASSLAESMPEVADLDPKFNFGLSIDKPGFSFEKLVVQLRDARRQVVELEERLERERATVEPLLRRIQDLEAQVERESPRSASLTGTHHRSVGRVSGRTTEANGPIVSISKAELEQIRKEHEASGALSQMRIEELESTLSLSESKLSVSSARQVQLEELLQKLIAEKDNEIESARREVKDWAWKKDHEREKIQHELSAAHKRMRDLESMLVKASMQLAEMDELMQRMKMDHVDQVNALKREIDDLLAKMEMDQERNQQSAILKYGSDSTTISCSERDLQARVWDLESLVSKLERQLRENEEAHSNALSALVPKRGANSPCEELGSHSRQFAPEMRTCTGAMETADVLSELDLVAMQAQAQLEMLELEKQRMSTASSAERGKQGHSPALHCEVEQRGHSPSCNTCQASRGMESAPNSQVLKNDLDLGHGLHVGDQHQSLLQNDCVAELEELLRGAGFGDLSVNAGQVAYTHEDGAGYGPESTLLHPMPEATVLHPIPHAQDAAESFSEGSIATSKLLEEEQAKVATLSTRIHDLRDTVERQAKAIDRHVVRGAEALRCIHEFVFLVDELRRILEVSRSFNAYALLGTRQRRQDIEGNGQVGVHRSAYVEVSQPSTALPQSSQLVREQGSVCAASSATREIRPNKSIPPASPESESMLRSTSMQSSGVTRHDTSAVQSMAIAGGVTTQDTRSARAKVSLQRHEENVLSTPLEPPALPCVLGIVVKKCSICLTSDLNLAGNPYLMIILEHKSKHKQDAKRRTVPGGKRTEMNASRNKMDVWFDEVFSFTVSDMDQRFSFSFFDMASSDGRSKGSPLLIGYGYLPASRIPLEWDELKHHDSHSVSLSDGERTIGSCDFSLEWKRSTHST